MTPRHMTDVRSGGHGRLQMTRGPKINFGIILTAVLPSLAIIAVLVSTVPAAADGPPVVTITSEGGLISGTYQLTAEVMGDLQPGEVYYWVDTDPGTLMTDEGGGVYQADVEVAELAEGPHTIYVKAVNTTGASTVASLPVDVDRDSPMVTLTSDVGSVSGDILITADVSDPYLNESAIYCVVDDDLEASREYLLSRVDDHYEITLDTTEFPDGDHMVRIWAFDLWGSFNKSVGTGMVVDNTPPTVTITSEGGAHSGAYLLQADVSDPHLDVLSVVARVGTDGPLQMDGDGPARSLDIDLRPYDNGQLVIQVDASDTHGNSRTGSVTITVDNKPDLVAVDAEWDRDSADAGQTVSLTVTVLNDGDAPAQGFTVGLFDGDTLLASTVVNDSLVPDESMGFSISWVVEGKGTRDLSVRVDADDDVVEYQETNNDLPDVQSFQVTRKKDDGESPGPGPSAVALAMALMVVAVRWRRR